MKETKFTPSVIKGGKPAAISLDPAATAGSAALSPIEANPVSHGFLCFAPAIRRRMTVLLCDSLATYNDIRSLMADRGQRRFFGVRIDAVAFAYSNAFQLPGSLLELERSLGDADGLCYSTLGGAFRPQVSYLYWGSISRPGVLALLGVYRANPGWQVRPFMPAYCAMLDAAYGRKLPTIDPGPESSFFLRLEPHFTPMQQSTYRMCLSRHQCIPTSILTKHALRKHARK